MNRLLPAAFLCLLAAGVAPAQAPPPLKWGADPTGGAPFIYQDAAGKYIGFEVELADYLAAKLGRTAELVDGDWANMPEQLKKPRDIEKGVDVIMNGYELRKDFAEQYGVTRPYYLYRLALMARRDNVGVTSWDDLKKGHKTVAVLGGTGAHRYMLDRFGDSVELLTNPDVANVIKLVNDNRMPATVQDGPCATYYVKEYPDLRTVAESETPGFYVLYYRKSDPELGQKLDGAIAAGLADGTLERIYRKYNIWTADQAELAGWQSKPWPPPFDDAPQPGRWPRLIRELVAAAGMTIYLAVLSFPLAMTIGLAVAIGRVYGPRWVRVPCGVYVEVIRGTPLLLQLFFIYYVIPDMLRNAHISDASWLTPLLAGVLGLAINYSAYEAENYRAGLTAIPAGQMEAALALGMSRRTAIRRIVVPQAVRIVIPPVTNDFIALFKDTSACSILFVVELTRKYNELFNFNRDLVIELGFLTAGLYLMMSYPLALLAGRLERKLTPGAVGGGA